jgi:hypothetical protein
MKYRFHVDMFRDMFHDEMLHSSGRFPSFGLSAGSSRYVSRYVCKYSYDMFHHDMFVY